MNRLVSLVALVAYLTGGWLLPVMHRHHAPAEISAVDGHGTSCDEAHHCHAHTHDRPSDDSKTDELEPATGDQLVAHSSHLHTCQGLCALCLARTLTSTSDTKSDVDDRKPAPRLLSVAAAPLWFGPGANRNHLSRGPPAWI